MKDILVIGDRHAAPGQSFAQDAKLGFYLTSKGRAIEQVVIIGDYMDMGSLSRFDVTGSKAMEGARIEKDLRSGEGALRAMLNFAWPGDHKRKIIFIEGNHEERLKRMYEEHPKLTGLASVEERLGNVAAGFGWDFSYTPYREYVTLAPSLVATHVPHNNMQPIGTARVLGLSAKSVIWGHSHQLHFSTLSRNGAKQIFGLNVGCFIDPKYDPPYMAGKIKDWWRGVIVLHLPDQGPWRGEFTPISLQQLTEK